MRDISQDLHLAAQHVLSLYQPGCLSGSALHDMHLTRSQPAWVLSCVRMQPLLVARAPLGVLNDKPVRLATAQPGSADAKDWKLTAQVCFPPVWHSADCSCHGCV